MFFTRRKDPPAARPPARFTPRVESPAHRINPVVVANPAVGPGPGAGPQVRVFDAATGVERYSFLAYEASFTGGVRVATGDLNRDGVDDIVVAPAVGGSARIKVYDGKFGTQIDDFFVFEP